MKKILAIILSLSLVMNSSAVVFAAPDLPSLPDAPSVPDAPDSPDIPDEPESPETSEEPERPDNYVPDDPLSPEVVEGQGEEPVEEDEDPEPEIIKQEYIESEGNDENNQNNQVGDPEINTGDAVGTGQIINTGNSNEAFTPEYDTGSSISVANEGNGADSENTGSIAITDDSATTQNNNADLDNSLAVSTDTGDNSTSGNVGNSYVGTGNANTTGTIFNSVNTNVDGVTMSEFNVVDDQIGDLILDYENNCVTGCDFWEINTENAGNGSDSTNISDIDLAVNDVTFQGNDAEINNELVLMANTGNNTADNNTGGDSQIETGNAKVAGNVVNIANNNFAGGVVYGVVNIFGDLAGDIYFPEEMVSEYGLDLLAANTGNGSDSTNLTDVDLLIEDRFNQMNQADIINNLNLEATTGGNMVSDNTGGDNFIETGDADIDVNVINIANSNMIGGNWWIVIVNEAGNWVGKIFGLDSNVGNNIALSGGQASMSDNGVIDITNADNGTGSKNTSDVDAAFTSSIDQINTANINNDVTIAANTGGNSASRNTGGDNEIITGDADIVLNIVNFVNNNFIGGNVFLTVVNVFGDWMGNFIGPNGAPELASNTQQESNQDSGVGGASGGSSSNTSSDPSSSSSSSASSSAPVATSVPLVAGISTTRFTSDVGVVDEVLAADSGSILGGNTEDKTTVNLAWAVLAIPALFGGILARKYHLLAKLAAIAGSMRR